MTDPREERMGIYLGDGAYVKREDEFIVVYTHNGYHSTNSVYLDRSVVRALRDYLIKETK